MASEKYNINMVSDDLKRERLIQLYQLAVLYEPKCLDNQYEHNLFVAKILDDLYELST